MIKSSVGLKVLIMPISVALVIVIALLFVKPTYDDVTKTKKMIKENKEQINKIAAQNKALSAMKGSMSSMAEEKSMIQMALPEKESVDYYIAELYSRANRSGVLLSSVSVPGGSSNQCVSTNVAVSNPSGTSIGGQNIQPVGETEGIPAPEASLGEALPPSPAACLYSSMVEANFKGTWEQMLSFLKNINEMNRISNIKKISISSTAQSTESGQEISDLLSASISADVYYKAATKDINQSTIVELASKGQFDGKIIDKIKGMISYQFNPPVVSEVTERNIFK